VDAGRRLSRERALEHLIARYLGAALFTREGTLGRLFGLPTTEIARAVRSLVAGGALSETEIASRPGRWLVAPAAIPGPHGRSREDRAEERVLDEAHDRLERATVRRVQGTRDVDLGGHFLARHVLEHLRRPPMTRS